MLKRHTPEQIITKLRQAEVELGAGATVGQVAQNEFGNEGENGNCTGG